MQTPDPAKLNERSVQLAGLLRGAGISVSISLGVRLGMYKHMRDAGPISSDLLAQHSGYHERWVREWLYAQAASQIIDYVGGGRFELPADTAALLTEPESLRSLESVFRGLPERVSLTDKVEESFRTGIGFRFDARGDSVVSTLEGIFANWQRQVFIEGALPAFEGVTEMLTSGVSAGDIGCGTGVALLELAKAFPKSTFHGYDHSDLLLAAGNKRLHEAKVSNASFHNNENQPLSASPTYHFVMTFDCLHDMAHPDELAVAIRQAMHPDGIWFIADIDGAGTFEDNLRDNPGPRRCTPTLSITASPHLCPNPIPSVTGHSASLNRKWRTWCGRLDLAGSAASVRTFRDSRCPAPVLPFTKRGHENASSARASAWA